ncbi:MAG: hypothetical protein IT440_06555 [Phycisphaeraceae bacterium]|nr:hypothetical protein [Phycisphaeraceae bacterium]
MSATLKKWAHGAAGIVRSIAGIGVISPEEITRRRGICHHCQFARPCALSKRQMCSCSVCGCQIVHKTRLAGEQCPMNYW